MAAKIRMTRMGGKGRPFYRIVVADERSPRDGRFLELLGTYDPTREPESVTLRSDRIDYWMSKGAKPSLTVKQVLKRHAQTA